MLEDTLHSVILIGNLIYYMLHFFNACSNKSTPTPTASFRLSWRGINKKGPSNQLLYKMWKGGIGFVAGVLQVLSQKVFLYDCRTAFSETSFAVPHKRTKFVTRISLIFFWPLLGVGWKSGPIILLLKVYA